MNKVTVINAFYIGILTLHAHLDALGGPDTHALGLQLGKGDPASIVQKNIDVFLGHILLFPEKAACPLDGYAPGFFFQHSHPLLCMIQQITPKREMQNY